MRSERRIRVGMVCCWLSLFAVASGCGDTSGHFDFGVVEMNAYSNVDEVDGFDLQVFLAEDGSLVDGIYVQVEAVTAGHPSGSATMTLSPGEYIASAEGWNIDGDAVTNRAEEIFTISAGATITVDLYCDGSGSGEGDLGVADVNVVAGRGATVSTVGLATTPSVGGNNEISMTASDLDGDAYSNAPIRTLDNSANALWADGTDASMIAFGDQENYMSYDYLGDGFSSEVEKFDITIVDHTSIAGTYITINASRTDRYYVWFNKGGVPPVSPDNTWTLIEVVNTSEDDAAAVAAATAAAIDNMAEFTAFQSGNVVSVTNATAGRVPDPQPFTAASSVTLTVTGYGYDNSAIVDTIAVAFDDTYNGEAIWFNQDYSTGDVGIEEFAIRGVADLNSDNRPDVIGLWQTGRVLVITDSDFDGLLETGADYWVDYPVAGVELLTFEHVPTSGFVTVRISPSQLDSQNGRDICTFLRVQEHIESSCAPEQER